MSEGNSYEVTPTNESFNRERFVKEKIDRATGDLAGCIELNPNFEDLNSQEQPIVREPNQERPLPTNTLLSLFGGARYVKDPDSVPMFSKDEIENEYPDDQKELIEARGIDIYPYTFEPNPDLGENMTPDDVVSALVIARTLSNKFTKQPVEYVDSVDLESIKISPEMKQKALGLMLEDGDNSLKKTVETVSKVPPIYISDDDVKYLVEARRDKGVDPKEAEEEIRAILFDEWENLPKGMLRDVLKTEGYDNLGDNAEKEQTMGELIGEVYPLFDKYMEDVDSALELAFTDREKFIKKYVEDESVRKGVDRVLSDLREKLPRLNYKTASALGSMVFIITACAPIVSGGTEETVPKESEVPEQTEAISEIGEENISNFVIEQQPYVQDREGNEKKQEVIKDESKFYINEIDEKFVDSINITKWDNYEVESVREIHPQRYIPIITSYVYNEGGEEILFNTPLFILPIDRQTGKVDDNLPILQYNLTPILFRSLKIGRVYEVKTPENIKLTFGAPPISSSERRFNGELLVLMEVSDLHGNDVKFMQLEESREATESLQRSLWPSRGHLELDFSDWENGVKLFKDIRTTEFLELLQAYDPESLDWYKDIIYYEGSEKVSYPPQRRQLGEKYSLEEIQNFVEIFNNLLSP